MPKLSEILLKRASFLNIFAPDQVVGDAVSAMSQRAVGAVLVVEAGCLIGIFSERDLLRRVIFKKLSVETTLLRQVMTENPVTASPEDDRMSAIVKMRTVGCRHLPIIHGGQIVDTVSIRDLLFDEIEARDGEIEELKRYIQGA
jgi:CBS domain-containing protein